MKILILGSEGFIGKSLVNFFIKKDFELTGCDLFERPSLEYEYVKISRLSPEIDEVLRNGEFDFCVNAAGSGNVPYSMSHPLIDFEANSLDVMKILEAIRLNQPTCRYLHISSAAVYGSPIKLPVQEEDSCQPLSPYGWHKLIAEKICEEYHQIHNLKIAIVRPFSVYGPGLKKQLLWDLHQKYKKNPSKVELWGTGKESRDFIYIDDLVDSFYKIILKSPFENDIYNLASGVETTISELCNSYFNILDINCEFEFNKQSREGDPLNWVADISKISKLGYKPRFTLDKGVENYLQWIIKLQEQNKV